MKPILDPCCGSRMWWFDKQDSRAVFTDKRREQHTLCDGRELIIEPDILVLTDQKPVVGHRSGKRSNTHWICFLKQGN